MDVIIVVVLCFIGLLLLLAEIFLIPGFTITGIGGTLFALAGVWFAFNNLGSTGGLVTLTALALALGIAFVTLIRSKALDAISLTTNIDSKVVESQPRIAIGDRGTSVSRLNPMGKVRVNGITIEAKTTGDFIDENTEIEVVKVLFNQVIVK